MTSALFDNPAELLVEREPPEPPRGRQRADIEAQLARLGALQRAGYVVHLGTSGT